MTNRLEAIILQKHHEVSALKTLIQQDPTHAIAKILRDPTQRPFNNSFKNALRHSSLSVIAEIKRKSPSKGFLADIEDPGLLAKKYVAGGANAISVLTDELFFGGTLEDLKQVRSSLVGCNTPILRKDFIIDEIQIAEAAHAGADAILCIVAVLGKKTQTLLKYAKKIGIDVLVEVHNSAELEIALASDAEIIGINNRDLTTFDVNTEQALRLVESIPAHIIKVAESGILAPEMAQECYRSGFDAVLIGEALVTSTSPADFIKACRYD
jgi:indole-3-glycerol phosphate synthase